MPRKSKADRPVIGVGVQPPLNSELKDAMNLIAEQQPPVHNSEEAIVVRHLARRQAALNENAEFVARQTAARDVLTVVASTPPVVIPLTDWHDKSLHPARVGVYKTREPDGDEDMVIGFSHWSGATWGPQFESKDMAFFHKDAADTPDKEWRGLAEEHPDDAL